MTVAAKQDGQTLPYGLNLFSGSGLGSVRDNFDRYFETFNGKDTLHDTVGIAYQRISAQEPRIEEIPVQQPPARRVQRKRSFERTGLEIEPYRKKSKLVTAMAPKKKI